MTDGAPLSAEGLQKIAETMADVPHREWCAAMASEGAACDCEVRLVKARVTALVREAEQAKDHLEKSRMVVRGLNEQVGGYQRTQQALMLQAVDLKARLAGLRDKEWLRETVFDATLTAVLMPTEVRHTIQGWSRWIARVIAARALSAEGEGPKDG